MSHLTADLLAFIERWLPPPPARVLEVGCGDGTVRSARLHFLLHPRSRLVVFEFAVEHVDDAARRWLGGHGLARQARPRLLAR